jgi:hypothetical protein
MDDIAGAAPIGVHGPTPSPAADRYPAGTYLPPLTRARPRQAATTYRIGTQIPPTGVLLESGGNHVPNRYTGAAAEGAHAS